MVLRDDTWHLVRSVEQVSGFLGGRERPTPLSKDEVSRIQGSVEEMREDLKDTLHFEVGECVQVTDGPFTSFSGLVEAVDLEKNRLKVSVAIFGRPTPESHQAMTQVLSWNHIREHGAEVQVPKI